MLQVAKRRHQGGASIRGCRQEVQLISHQHAFPEYLLSACLWSRIDLDLSPITFSQGHALSSLISVGTDISRCRWPPLKRLLLSGWQYDEMGRAPALESDRLVLEAQVHHLLAW